MKPLLTTDSGIAIALDKDEPLVSHRDISIALGIEPRSMMQLIKDYLCDFQELGVVRFQNAKPPKGTDGGRPERIAYLNEDQSVKCCVKVHHECGAKVHQFTTGF